MSFVLIPFPSTVELLPNISATLCEMTEIQPLATNFAMFDSGVKEFDSEHKPRARSSAF